MNTDRIEEIMLKYGLRQLLTQTEQAMLDAWRHRSPAHHALPEKFRDEAWVKENLHRLQWVPSERIHQEVLKTIRDQGRGSINNGG